MDISTLANLVNAAAVTVGVIFAAVQIHHCRQRRRRDAMIELLRSFQSRDFTRALRRVNSLPDGADLQKIREVLGPDGADDVFMLRSDVGEPRRPALSPGKSAWISWTTCSAVRS